MAATGTRLPTGATTAGAIARVGLGRDMMRSGLEWTKFGLGFGKYAGKGAGRLLGPAATLYFGTYKGYKKGGAWGAVKGTAQNLGESFVFGAAMKGISRVFGPTGFYAGAGTAAVAASGLGAWTGGWLGGAQVASPWQAAVRPLVSDYMRRHAELELGRPIVDQFGTLATMRQRSLAAIQNSKINGRSAISNEATLSYRPYFR